MKPFVLLVLCVLSAGCGPSEKEIAREKETQARRVQVRAILDEEDRLKAIATQIGRYQFLPSSTRSDRLLDTATGQLYEHRLDYWERASQSLLDLRPSTTNAP